MDEAADSGHEPGRVTRWRTAAAAALARRRTVARVIGATLLALGVITGVGVVLAYNHWNGNLDVESVDGQLENRPGKSTSGDLNILVLGDDSRDGAGNRIDDEGGGGSDTTILFHLSADRTFAYGISIPRDTLVDRPRCKTADGKRIPAAQDVMWNEAYQVGGPGCTIQQFEQLSGVRIDQYVVVRFQGFKDMVEALDGVEVCIPERIEDDKAGITLEPGTREIRGNEALSYVRVRKGVDGGDGTDPQRIKRQQAFMASMIEKALKANMLARPDRLVGFMNAATDSLTTDFENVAQMVDIARSFNGIGLDNISFVTTPWQFSKADPNRVEWLPSVPRLWDLVIHDRPLTAEFRDDAIDADTGEGRAGASDTADPDDSADGKSEGGAADGGTERPEGEQPEREERSPGVC